jgi:hypothetical protein
MSAVGPMATNLVRLGGPPLSANRNQVRPQQVSTDNLCHTFGDWRATTIASRSFWLDAGFLDDRSPLVDFVLEMNAELARR